MEDNPNSGNLQPQDFNSADFPQNNYAQGENPQFNDYSNADFQTSNPQNDFSNFEAQQNYIQANENFQPQTSQNYTTETEISPVQTYENPVSQNNFEQINQFSNQTSSEFPQNNFQPDYSQNQVPANNSKKIIALAVSIFIALIVTAGSVFAFQTLFESDSSKINKALLSLNNAENFTINAEGKTDDGKEMSAEAKISLKTGTVQVAAKMKEYDDMSLEIVLKDGSAYLGAGFFKKLRNSAALDQPSYAMFKEDIQKLKFSFEDKYIDLGKNESVTKFQEEFSKDKIKSRFDGKNVTEKDIKGKTEQNGEVTYEFKLGEEDLKMTLANGKIKSIYIAELSKDQEVGGTISKINETEIKELKDSDIVKFEDIKDEVAEKVSGLIAKFFISMGLADESQTELLRLYFENMIKNYDFESGSLNLNSGINMEL